MLDSTKDFEYERRFWCVSIPSDMTAVEKPELLIQSYYVHSDNYALRVRMLAPHVQIEMTADTDPMRVIAMYRDYFTKASVTVKGPSVGGTRYEAERDIDPTIAAELIMRGGSVNIKNRYTVFAGQDGWNIDVFGANNAPLVVAEAERSVPVTNLVIPSFCTTEITDDVRFSNDGLATKPYSEWAHDYSKELAAQGPHFLEGFGKNRPDPSWS